MMEECENCKTLKERKNILYEDAVCVAVLPENAATPGHIRVFPKQHVHMLEKLDDELSNHLFFVASNAAMTVFEAVGAHGTNIIINNGIGNDREHVTIDVIPRKGDDGLDFMWKGKSASMDELDEVKEMLNQHTQFITPQEAKRIEEKGIEAEEEKSPEDSEEELLLRTLDRIP
jgi:diadenosine tetraphosphate (Ap4A) HIT family hydrolase